MEWPVLLAPARSPPPASRSGPLCSTSPSQSSGSRSLSHAALPGLAASVLALGRKRNKNGLWTRGGRCPALQPIMTALGTTVASPQTAVANRGVNVADALCAACRDGKTKHAIRLLEEWPEQARDAMFRPPADGKLSPLSWASSRNLADVVELMVERFPGAVRASVSHALFQACRRGHLEIAKLLAEAFPEEARSCAGRDLREACRAGYTEVVQLILRSFPEEARTVAGQALNEACLHGRSKIATVLLEAFPEEAQGALKTEDRLGHTPLHGACRTGLVGVTKRLFERFPEESRVALEVADEVGRTPLAWACEHRHEGVVQFLIARFPGSLAKAAPMKGFENETSDLPEMLPEGSREGLEHSGYRLVGSHSAVKQCRWTRNALLGQGQCYKHTFYGINSHQCMEATPSLACANKCTFCWRNHKNPVATSWDFKTDDPEWIVQESVRNHLELVDATAESPVALPERILEARTVRHTALSLVGEPVLYPRRTEFINSLHKRRISTFLVTNGQFPDELSQLPWVTQLYVSLDAPDAAELKEIGRPLFKDYWERLRESLTILQEKKPQQRTVCRLTVLKGQNMSDAGCDGYAELIGLSRSDFVEIKGATFAPVWEKHRSGLSFDSIPMHEDVRDFAERLAARLPLYSLACEHKHSACVLLARRDRFFEPWGCWHTWIDYERFADAAASGNTLNVTEFAAATPEWALAKEWRVDSPESNVGFDPQEKRRFRRRISVGKEKRQTPRHNMMGDVAVLSPQDGLDNTASADMLLQLPHVRSVAVFEPVGTGLELSRVGIRHIAGDPSLEITHKEWGLQFKLDLARRLSRLSRSQGGFDERSRISQLVKAGERVLVLNSGIGLTACILGRRTSCLEVVGVEADPVKHEFALANIELNKLSGRVASMLGDPFDPSTMGDFDRVCAFLPFQRQGKRLTFAELISPAMAHLVPGGTLHIYNHETEEEFSSEPAAAKRAMATCCGDRGFELTWRGKVPRKSIGRNWFRVGYDFRVD